MTKTEAALAALFSALKTGALDQFDVLPSCVRNQDIVQRLVKHETGTVEWFLGLWDGDSDVDAEMLGADVIEGGYEIIHVAPLEFAVAGGSDDERETRFDDGFEAIDTVIKSDRTLGGVVDDCRIIRVEGNQQRFAELGLPNVKAATLRVQLSFTSSGIR